jgi:hypothetical protein
MVGITSASIFRASSGAPQRPGDFAPWNDSARDMAMHVLPSISTSLTVGDTSLTASHARAQGILHQADVP